MRKNQGNSDKFRIRKDLMENDEMPSKFYKIGY